MTWKGSKLLKHALQFVLVLAALYTGLSRISDYKHHCESKRRSLMSERFDDKCFTGSDVLGGSLLGIATAVVVSSMSHVFRRKSNQYDKPEV